MKSRTSQAVAEPAREHVLTPRDFERARRMIHTRAGIALAEGKMDMVYSRLVRRLRATGKGSFTEYLSRLEAEPASVEWEQFTNALTTNLTAFFREPHHFDLMREHFGRGPARRRRIWCAAASTGEEPYSIAIAVAEHFDTFQSPVEIFSSDIDTQVLATAQRGVYPLERVEKLSSERLRRFFQKGSGAQEGYCRVRSELRERVQFLPLNLLDSRWPLEGLFDVIFCRNVMIYFDKPTQYRILQKLGAYLQPDGLLMAGHSESFFHASDLVKPCGRTVYQLSDVERARRKAA